MKRAFLLGVVVLLPVITVHASSNWFFATEAQVSNYWRATQTVLIQPDDEFFSDGDEGEQATFISSEDELFISGEDDHTAPVEMEEQGKMSTEEPEELLIDEQEEQPTPAELEDIEEQAEPVEIEGES